MGDTPDSRAYVDQCGPARYSRNVMLQPKTEINPLARRMVATGAVVTRL